MICRYLIVSTSVFALTSAYPSLQGGEGATQQSSAGQSDVEINAKIAHLDIDRATREDVIRVFGERVRRHATNLYQLVLQHHFFGTKRGCFASQVFRCDFVACLLRSR